MRRTITAIAAIIAIVGGARADTSGSGKYCVFGKGRAYDMLLTRPRPDGSLLFALTRWTPSGSNFSVAGTAQPRPNGWQFRENMDSSDPDQRCAVNIARARDGGYVVATVEGARCEALAGHGAALYGADAFPPVSRAGDAPARFGIEDLERIGCDRRR